MTTWLSTHGIGAIKDSQSSFSITADKGSALIKPTNPSQLSGYIHFTIPSPPVNNPNLKAVAVDFSSQSASVDTVLVYLANNEEFKKENLQRGQSFQLDISDVAYGGKGIALMILVNFNSVDSTLNFQSVGIQV